MPPLEMKEAAVPPDLRAISDEVKRSVVQWHRARNRKNGKKRPLNAMAPEGKKAGGKHKRSKHCGEANDAESQGASSEEEKETDAAQNMSPSVLGAKGGGNQKRVIKTFEERVDELAAYIEKHGHVNVKESKDKRLADFCYRMRYARKNPEGNKVKLTKNRVASLDALGFDWEPQGKTNNESFLRRLEELKAFKAEHGHLNVKRSGDKSLYQFCAQIRSARKHPKSADGMRLTEERIASLDALGFDWAPKIGGNRKADTLFQERIEELKAYKAKHGHVSVKESDDKSLYGFCNNVRQASRGRGNVKLTKERIASLNALGFDWEPQNKKVKRFQEKVEELKAYKAKHGHLKVKQIEDKACITSVTTSGRPAEGRER